MTLFEVVSYVILISRVLAIFRWHYSKVVVLVLDLIEYKSDAF